MSKAKLLLVGLLVGLVALAASGAVSAFNPCYTCALGDANEDGVINVLDITTTELMAAGLRPPTFAADVNRDAVINVLDITAVEILVASS